MTRGSTLWLYRVMVVIGWKMTQKPSKNGIFPKNDHKCSKMGGKWGEMILNRFKIISPHFPPIFEHLWSFLGKIPFFDGFWVIFQPITTMTLYSHRVDPRVILDDPPYFRGRRTRKNPENIDYTHPRGRIS